MARGGAWWRKDLGKNFYLRGEGCSALAVVPSAWARGEFNRKAMGKGTSFHGEMVGLVYTHTARVRVRYGETDAMGYVYYGNYPLYFEVGRNETMRSLGFPYGRLEEEGVMMPVVDLSIRYVTPAHYDDELNVHTGVLALRGATLEFGYRIERESDSALIVWGTTALAFVDRETRRPLRPPRIILEKLDLRKG